MRTEHLVEIHVPIADHQATAWVDAMQEQLFELVDQADGDDFSDEGEQVGDEYVYLLYGVDTDALVTAGRTAARRSEVPAGAYAIVSSDETQIGVGRRVDLQD